jgi:signal transduction histidine kinase
MRPTIYAFFGVLIVALVSVGSVADRVLVDQARSVADAARAEDDRRARLAPQAVRATLAQIEQAVTGDMSWPGVRVVRAVDSDTPLMSRASTVPYGKRSEAELIVLLSSTGLSGSGLPEAVVAAVALGRPDHQATVAERLLSGILPVRPDDLPYLADVLGFGGDPRVESVRSRLGRVPPVGDVPDSPVFRRTLTNQRSLEGWSRSAGTLRHYEVGLDALLEAAGLAGRASISADQSPSPPSAGTLVVPVPEADGLALAIAPDTSGQLRLRTLRIVLWAAVLTSLLGLGAVLRGLSREARAVAREKAFLSSVTHELRTPLAAIRLVGERLATDRGDPRAYGGIVATESQRLETLVEHVLAATRSAEHLTLTRLNPVDVIRSAVELIMPTAERYDVTVSVDGSAAELSRSEATWDRDAVRRALLNLLDNAIKHGRHGGLVTVTGAVAEGFVRLSVTDDGPGIGRRDRRRVFGRFERASSQAPGAGLGLYVAEGIARAHGGRIDLVTEEGRGSTFTLVLPVVPPDKTVAEPSGAIA